MGALDMKALESAFGSPISGDPFKVQPAAPPPGLVRLTPEQQEVVLTLGRRAMSCPLSSMLAQDSVQLVSQALKADHHGLAQPSADGTALILSFQSHQLHDGCTEKTYKYPTRESDSLVGYAISKAIPVLTDRLEHETRFKDAFMRKMKAASAIAVPLQQSGQSFGAIAVYSSQLQRFTTDDLTFLEMVAHVLTAAMAHSRIEELLQNERSFCSALFSSTSDVAIGLDIEGRVLLANRSCAQLTGFKSEDLEGRHVWNVLTAPDEQLALNSILSRLKLGEPEIQHTGVLISKDGARKSMIWTLSAVKDGQQQTVRVLLCGTPFVSKSGESLDRPRAGKDMRSSPRKSFSFPQMIAPVTAEGGTPKPGEFMVVECNDISAGGISFVLDYRPEFKEAVIVLGSPPNVTSVVAEIVRISTTTRDGRIAYLIGCRFTGRA